MEYHFCSTTLFLIEFSLNIKISLRFCILISVTTVIVDQLLDSCSAGGVEILGLHATVAPRRQGQQAPPILEDFNFVPYMDTKPVDDEQKLYLNHCKATLIHGLDKLLNNGYSNEDYNIELLKQCVREMTSELPNGFIEELDLKESKSGETLLQLLKDMDIIEHSDHLVSDIKTLFEARRASLNNDKAMGSLLKPERLKSCLGVALENTLGSRLKITEISAVEGQMYNHVIPQLNTEPMLKIEYFALCNKEEDFGDSAEALDISPVVLEETNQTLPKTVQNSDLVLMNCLMSGECSDTVNEVSRVFNCMKDGGFLLIHKPVENMAFINTLTGLRHGLLRNSWSKSDQPVDLVKAIEDMGCVLVMHTYDGLMNELLLFRKPLSSLKTQQIIEVSDLGYGWVDKVKTAMVAENCDCILQVSNGEPSGVIGMVNCLRLEPGGECFRYKDNMHS